MCALLHTEQKVQVCDATVLNAYSSAGAQKLLHILKRAVEHPFYATTPYYNCCCLALLATHFIAFTNPTVTNNRAVNEPNIENETGIHNPNNLRAGLK